jgi:hypothetical protein
MIYYITGIVKSVSIRIYIKISKRQQDRRVKSVTINCRVGYRRVRVTVVRKFEETGS